MIEVEKIAGLPPDIATRIAPLFSGVDWPAVAADLRSGRAELFRVGEDSFAVVRFDVDTREAVVMGYTGRDVVGFARVFVAAARQTGALAVRFHTASKGLARLLSEFGPVESETVYKVAV